MVDVSIVDDGKHERSNGACLLRVQTEIVDKMCGGRSIRGING